MRRTSAVDSTSTIVHTGRRGVLRKAVLVVVALTLLSTLPAVPVAADHEPPSETHTPAGSGELHGTELVEEQEGFPCFRVTRHLFGLRGAGTYEGRTAAGGPVVFRGEVAPDATLHADGPLQVQFENTEVYYQSPFGTHGTEGGGGAGCSPSTVGDPVPAEFRIFAAEGSQDIDGDQDVDVLTGTAWVYRVNDGGDKVPCRGSGSYARGTKSNPGFADPTWEAEWILEEDCVVVGNAAGTPGTGTAPRGTFMTHHGDHGPCFNWPCANNLKTGYKQHLPKPGPYLHLSGPDSATVGCDAVRITARLTDTGWPVADASVSFSVSGPGPAVPPAAVLTTDQKGEAPFAFTAAVAGDYTVSATATYNGQDVSATHVVHFADPLPPSISVTGPGKWQTEEDATVTATVKGACGVLPGTTVDFEVEWPSQNVPWTGQATPDSGSAVTDANGQATFIFSGDRAGDYAVTATSRLPTGERASDIHAVHMDIRTLKRDGAVTLPDSEQALTAAVMEPAGEYAYFGGRGVVEKIDLATFERVDALQVRTEGNVAADLRSAVIDPAGEFAYFGAMRGRVYKVDLASFELVGALALDPNEDSLYSAVIDPAGRYAYFGSIGAGRIVKVDLATFTRAGAIDTKFGAQDLGFPLSAVMDPAGDYAYFGTTDLSTGWVLQVDLATFTNTRYITLPNGENQPAPAVIDPAGDFAYFGTTNTRPGKVVKIDLRAFQRVGAIDLAPGEAFSWGSPATSPAVIDPAGDFAYFGAYQGFDDTLVQHLPAKVVKVDLRTFERAHAITLEPGSGENFLASGVIDPTGGYAYFGTKAQTRNLLAPPPDRVVKVQLKRPPNPDLVAGDDAYATDYKTPLTVPAPGVLANDTHADGDPLVAGQASDPPRGSVSLQPDGSLSYTPIAGFSGTDTFTYVASDGRDYSAPATVSVEVGAPTEDEADGLAFGYYTDVSLFGGDPEVRGYGQAEDAPEEAASPAVACPEGGGADSAADPDGARAVYGPAVIFGGIWPDDNNAAPPSGPLGAQIDCQLGSGGHVSASTSVTRMPEGSTWTTPGGATEPHPGGVGPGPFIADEVHSSCTMTAEGVISDVTVVNGVLETKYDANTQEPVESEAVPQGPPANYTREGTIDHVGDSYRVVFNEQAENPDGSVTVNAVHLYLLGPTAVGDVVIGSSTCGPLTTATQPDSGAIAGTVTDAASGEPIADATLTVSDGDGSQAGQTSTDADGGYTIAGLDAGDYTVTAAAEGYQPASQDATVTAGQTTPVDFALTPTAAEPGALAGQVSDAESGAPIAGATITAVDADGVEATVTTDTGGDYRIDGLDAGEYTVTAQADGYETASDTAQVDAGQTATVDFALTPTTAEPGAVAGTVSDAESGAPIAGATVTAVDADGGQATAVSDTGGDYRIDDLDPGEYTVTAKADGYEPASDTAQVDAGQSATVDFALTRQGEESGQIAGQVIQHGNNRPVAGATVTAVDADGAQTSATTAADGTYRLDRLDAGSYTLTASADGYRPGERTATVQPGRTTTADFVLKKGGGGSRGGPGGGSGGGPPPGKGPNR